MADTAQFVFQQVYERADYLELDEVMQLADTIGVIYGGQINKIAPASEFTTQEVGEYMMGVKK